MPAEIISLAEHRKSFLSLYDEANVIFETAESINGEEDTEYIIDIDDYQYVELEQPNYDRVFLSRPIYDLVGQYEINVSRIALYSYEAPASHEVLVRRNAARLMIVPQNASEQEVLALVSPSKVEWGKLIRREFKIDPSGIISPKDSRGLGRLDGAPFRLHESLETTDSLKPDSKKLLKGRLLPVDVRQEDSL